LRDVAAFVRIARFEDLVEMPGCVYGHLVFVQRDCVWDCAVSTSVSN
jgi:hypothetical protein